ncbi:MAG TPA: CehA/McbA family metallohydrolase [Thermomicrobiales bacterium]|nr:CehA/McbA family metallohydrolase [Thermomicrobiales bacterium]
MTRKIHLSTRFEPSEEKTFRHVPFDIPAGVHQFHISVSYNDRIDSSPLLNGGNTLDIGLFDQQGTESGGPGFRGWSGSVRTEITIDDQWATPPYRAGEIDAGTWNLLFGAYKVGPNGLDIEITISLDTGEEPPLIPPWPNLAELHRTSVPPAVEPGWYRGDLHMHTVYSDGDSYPHEAAAVAYQSGLDFYGITDHNRARSPIDLVPQGDGWPVLVPGVEVTTYAGHFNVWGTDRWYDFRNPTAEGIQAAVDAARADGGLISKNHPKPYGPPWEYAEVTGFDCIEPWNGWWGYLNNVSTGYWADALAAADASSWPVGVCGSDTHKNHVKSDMMTPLSEATMGFPTLWVQTSDELCAGSILAAIRAGRCFISESPSGPQVYVRRDGDELIVHVHGAEGDALLAVGPEGCVDAASIPGEDIVHRWPLRERIDAGVPFLRFEIHAVAGGIRALTNPVWLPR